MPSDPSHTTRADRCSFCPATTETVVVTLNGWLHDACAACALALVDPLFTTPVEVAADLPAKHRLLKAS